MDVQTLAGTVALAAGIARQSLTAARDTDDLEAIRARIDEAIGFVDAILDATARAVPPNGE